jgi:hypothetical protein
MDEPQEAGPEAQGGPETLESERPPELVHLVEEANEKLFKAGADSAEQSFGLGCLVFALPLLVGVVLLYIFGVFNLILALIVLAMGALAVAGIVTLMAYNARARTITDTYHREIEPQIAQALAQQQASRPQFDRLAVAILPEDAPLRAYLNPEHPTSQEL